MQTSINIVRINYHLPVKLWDSKNKQCTIKPYRSFRYSKSCFHYNFTKLHTCQYKYTSLDLIKMNNLVHSKIDPSNTCSLLCMTEDEVWKLCRSLDENKFTGINGVSPKLLTMIAPVLAEPLTKIFCLSICTGKIPPLNGNRKDRVTSINKLIRRILAC